MTICRLTGFFGCEDFSLVFVCLLDYSHWSFYQNKCPCKIPFLTLVFHVSGLSFLFLFHFLCIPLCRLNH
ncbi:hypothetical protein C8R42DRAFT_683243, partial [Lentinula raphanica]